VSFVLFTQIFATHGFDVIATDGKTQLHTKKEHPSKGAKKGSMHRSNAQ